MSDLFSKLKAVREQHARIIEQAGVDPFGARIENIVSPTRARVAGRSCILLGTNNYLGLTYDAEAIEAGAEAARQMGTGTTGSRAANGNYACHQDFERQIADFFGCERAVLFTTGYQANVGVISALAGREDVALIDEDSHASIYDGCRLANATALHFRHNDAKDLRRRLSRLPKDAGKLVVVEGIYSMLGDRAPLAEIVEAAKAYGACVMVDEAHSLGVLGENGRGLAEEVGVEDEVDFIVGTFSKSVGAIGGFCVSRRPELDSLHFASRPYLFTASLPPSVVASSSKALERIRKDRALRAKLWANTDFLYEGLAALGLEVGPDKTPVIGVRMPSLEAGLAAWKRLHERGVYVNLATAPATPRGVCLLRCSLCAAHTRRELGSVLEAFGEVADLLGAGQPAPKKAAAG